MSKSVGNVVDPVALIDRFGVDQVRYFLLREVPFGQDGSYSDEAIITRINADLANEFGNLAQRSLSMVAKNLDGVVPEPVALDDDDRELLAAADALLERVRAHFDVPAMHLALEAIWLVLGAANKYFSAQQPWVLRKSEHPVRPRAVRHRAVHDAGGGAHRGAAGAAGDAGVGGQAAGPARPAGGGAVVRRSRHQAGARHCAAGAHRGVPALPGRVICVTYGHVSAIGGVSRA